MKRFLACILTMALLLTAIPMGSTADSTQYGVVHGGWLRLRQQPSFNARTLTSYYTGSVLTIHGYSNGWYQVTGPDSQQGYCYAYYVTLGGTPTPTPAGSSAWVTSANGLGVRMRTGPGTSYRVMWICPVGTEVKVLQRGTYWARIQFGVQVGYMMTKFLTDGTPYVPPTGSYEARVTSRNGYGVRLRTGPGTGYSIIGVYSVGTNVVVLNHGATWDYIRIGTRTGYMMTQFLTTSGLTTAITGVTLGDNSPVVGSPVTVASVTPSGASASVTYQWFTVDGSTVTNTGYTGASYTPSSTDAGKYIRVTVTGTGYYTGSATATTTDKTVAAQAITGVAINNPNPVVGDTLAAVMTPSAAKADRLWTVGTDTYTTDTYLVKPTDVGKTITVKVTGKGGYTGSQTSVQTAAVTNTGTLTGVTIDNTSPVEFETLTATVNPATATVTYQWVDGNNNVLGTGKTYPVTAKNATDGITIRVIATGQGSYSGSITSSATNAVTAATPLVGITLKPANACLYDTVSIDAIDPVAATEADNLTDYRWYINGTEVTAARGQTSFALNNTNWAGLALRLDVTGKNGYKGTVSGTISAIGTARTLTGTPTIGGLDGSGNATVKSALTANLGTVPAAANATYEWFVNGTSVGTGATYTPSVNDYGDTLVLKATAGNGSGYAGTVASADATVSGKAPLTGVPTITGTAKVGETLTAGRGTLPTDLPDAKIQYYWVRVDGSTPTTISTTPSATYQLTATEYGKTVCVIAVGTDDSGYVSDPAASGKVSSTLTATVAAAALTGTPSYSPANPVKNNMITASYGDVNVPSGYNDVKWSWYVGGSLVSDDNYQYTPTAAGSVTLRLTADANTAYTGYVETTITVADSATKLATPTGLAWSGATAQWTGVTGATGYAVKLLDAATGSDTGASIATVPAGTTQVDLNGYMTNGKSYKFSVQALGDSTVYTNSDTATSTDTYAKIMPTLAVPGNLNWSGATAQWDAVANASSYSVQLYKDGSPSDAPVSVVSNSNPFSIAEAGAYTFTVQAVGDGANYQSSTASAVSTATYTLLAAPTSAALASDGTATWTAVTGATGYTLKLYDATDTQVGFDVDVTGGASASYSFTGVTSDYYFKIVAKGDSASNIVDSASATSSVAP